MDIIAVFLYYAIMLKLLLFTGHLIICIAVNSLYVQAKL